MLYLNTFALEFKTRVQQPKFTNNKFTFITMRNLTLLFLLGIALTACEAEPTEDAIFSQENDTKPEIIDVYEDTNHGLGN